MRFFIIFLLTVIASLPSTAQMDSLSFVQLVKRLSPKAIPTPSGVWVETIREGTGNRPQADEYLQFVYTASIAGAKVFDKISPNEPIICQPNTGYMVSGVDRLLGAMRKGTMCRLYVPSQLGFAGTGVDNVPPHSPLVYEIEILDILSAAKYDEIITQQEAKAAAAFEKQGKAYFEEHKRKINDYAIKKKLKVKRTDSGLSYAITKEGKGLMAMPGDSVFVQYEGFLIDGDKLFDGTKKKAVFGFQLGNGGVIEGWDEGLQFFNKGAEGWLLVPAKLGYGANELKTKAGVLPSYSALAFKIKVVDIRKPK